jgi:hypothetical protein
MRLRRLYGIVTALLMLHISFVASDAACATHMTAGNHAEMSSAAHSGGMAADASMHSQMAHAAGRAQQQQPCETPSQANCCQALASCGSAFVSSDARSALPTLTRSEIFRRTVDTPASVFVAPDTPPPKA